MKQPDVEASSFIAGRLAHCDEQEIPTRDELGLETARIEAFEWQALRQYSDWWQTGALLKSGGDQSDWLHEATGLLGVVGELVLVSIEAEIEKEILARHIADGSCRSPNAHRRAIRFFAEGQANYLIVAGHALANLTLRTIAMHPQYQPSLLTSDLIPKKANFQPFSDDRRVWLSLNRDVAGELLRLAGLLGSPVMEALAQETIELATNRTWERLWEERGQQYHRFRFESPGVSGIDWTQSVARRIEARGSIGFGPSLLPSYSAADTLVDDLAALSREALEVLAEQMPTYRDVWCVARVEATS